MLQIPEPSCLLDAVRLCWSIVHGHQSWDLAHRMLTGSSRAYLADTLDLFDTIMHAQDHGPKPAYSSPGDRCVAGNRTMGPSPHTAHRCVAGDRPLGDSWRAGGLAAGHLWLGGSLLLLSHPS